MVASMAVGQLIVCMLEPFAQVLCQDVVISQQYYCGKCSWCPSSILVVLFDNAGILRAADDVRSTFRAKTA